MKPSKTLKSASMLLWMEGKEGMLLVIPTESPPRPRSGTASGGSAGGVSAGGGLRRTQYI